MPKPVTLTLVPKSFGVGYFWVAAFQGSKATGPVGIGDNPTEATNDLVDATELLLAMRPASASPVFTELQELPS